MADNFVTTLASLSSGAQRAITANAQSQGISPEAYLASRGGVNPVTGKFGDSFDAKRDLTDAEYKAAIAGKSGAALGAAINAATAAKLGTVSGGTGGGAGGGGGATPSGLKSEAQIAAEAAAAARQGERQSAYDLLYSQFAQYGLQALVDPLKNLIVSGASPAEFTIKLRESEPYKKRFSANAQRVAKGLKAIDEATYLGLEDQYQNIMRNYGLPASYYNRGEMGIQEGFTKLIANDVSAVELEDRVMTAQQRVLKANPEVAYALKNFYPDITNGDILAYALDPQNALNNIKRKVTAAEIGGAALTQGLTTTALGAEGLAEYGITKQQAQQGYQTVAGILPRSTQLAEIYGEQPYDQATAESEVFGTLGQAEAKKRREKLVKLEQGAFSGASGAAQGALGRERGLGQGQF
jgi:hypothetical protein